MINPKKKLKSVATITIFLAIVMVFAFFTTACQPTPENPVVVQKDNYEDLIGNTAQPTTQQTSTSTSTDTKQITWEDEFTQEYTTKNSPSTKLTVNVEADIDTQQKKASVFSVEPSEYDLDFAKRAVDYFIGDKYYDDMYTKDDFTKMILPLQQAIQGMQDINGSKGDAESQLKVYQHQYENAPQSNESGKIEFKNGKTNYIGLKGYPYDGAVSELYIGNGGEGNTDFYYVVQDGKKVYKDSNYAYAGTPARNMKKSYDEAKNIAADAINKVYGSDMSLVQTDLYNVYPIDNTYGKALKGLLDNSCNQCYMFTFTPIYGGLPQLYAPEAKNMDNTTQNGVPMYQQKWDYEYNMKWPAQYVQVLVDDSGIVQFWGFSPTKTTKTINENVEMQSFDQIFDQFKKDIFYSSVWSYSGIKEVDIKIDKIVFGMIREPVKDNPNIFYMIPAWQFIGSKTEIPDTSVSVPADIQAAMDQKKDELKSAGLSQAEIDELMNNPGYSESGKTFLVLNALDGSIVDTSYYVNVRGDLETTIGVNKD